MKNMKVGTRLLAAFIVVAIVGAIVAAIAIVNMQRMNAAAEAAYEQDLLGLSLSKEANINLVYIGRTMRTAILVGPDARPPQIERVRKLQKDMVGYLDQARPRYTTAEMKAMLADIDRGIVEYAKLTDQVLSMLNDDTPEGKAAAVDYLLKTVVPVANRVDEQLTALSKLKERAAGAAAKASSAQFERTRTLLIGLVLGSLALGVGLGLWITRKLTGQLGGEPAYATDVAGAIAAGNLAAPVALRAGDRSSLLFAMETMRQELVKIVSEVRSGTDTIATASSQIASGNLDLSSRTEEQASSLEETASSMEELTGTVRQNADNARQANTLATNASEVAARGGMVVTQVVGTMAAINDSSRKIVDIISVIDGIAFQTNILALNAAVEAARAGEQGRGFAVVASEVRNLAQRSANAAKEIKVLINDSVEKVEAGGKLVDQAGSTMDEVVASITRVTDIMSEIAAASGEQSTGIEQVNSAIVQMDQVTQQNAALVEEASAAAEAMQEQAASLQRLVDVFKLGQEQSAAPVRSGAAAPRRAPARPAPVPARAPAAHKPRLAKPAPAAQAEELWESV